MFEGCSSLKALNLSNFNTDKVTNMYGMFSNCWSLKDLILFDDNCNIINMEGMFNGCLDKLTSKIKDKYKYIKEEAFEFINDIYKSIIKNKIKKCRKEKKLNGKKKIKL